MTKKDAKGKGKDKDKSEDKKQPEMKYTITDLAEELEVEPATARVGLRKHGVEKVGGRYGWKTEKEMMAVVKLLKGKKKKAKDEDDDDDE